MTSGARQPSPFFAALCSRDVWLRAAPIGLAVGLCQAALHQGAHWFHGQLTAEVIVKTILSPLISLGVSIFSAAAVHARHTTPRAFP
jgi:hypothetical protein